MQSGCLMGLCQFSMPIQPVFDPVVARNVHIPKQAIFRMGGTRKSPLCVHIIADTHNEDSLPCLWHAKVGGIQQFELDVVARASMGHWIDALQKL